MEKIHRWGKGHGKDTEFPCPLQPSTWFSLKLPMFTNSKAHQTPLFWGILVSSLHLHDWLSHWQLMTELNLQTLSPPRRKSYPTLWDPTDCSMPDFPVHHQLPELAQIHIHVYELNKQGDNIQPWHTPFPILFFFFPPTGKCNILFFFFLIFFFLICSEFWTSPLFHVQF